MLTDCQGSDLLAAATVYSSEQAIKLQGVMRSYRGVFAGQIFTL